MAKVVVRPDSRRLRSACSFALSCSLHGFALAWVVLGPVMPKDRPASLYDQVIRPNKTRLVWYRLRDRLPEVSPSAQSSPHPARALSRSPQTLVAGKQDMLRSSQLIWLPAPPLETPQILPSPNVVALAAPARPVREFRQVEQPRPKLPAANLPEAPQIAAAPAKAVVLPPLARPQPRDFTPPKEEKPRAAQMLLPAAPELTVATASHTTPALNSLLRVQPARRTFIPPAEAARAPLQQPLTLPAAPLVEVKAVAQPLEVPLAPAARPVRGFTAPPPQPAPPARTVASLAEAPEVTTANRAPEASLAIVSLFPARRTEIPTPKASQEAGFSTGPQPRVSEEEAGTENHQLVIPGLLARDGAKDQPQPSLLAKLEAPTSLHNLLEASRTVRTNAAPPSAAAPDSRLSGRLVYTLAIQMPNITSYSGSWIVWFAERDPVPGQIRSMHPPSPLRKVDPKYIPSAADERVEGKVRLAAVIRKNGRVEAVELLQHLDTRLDRSAQEALSKWEFEPAIRDGAPVDVDAVFEIPFHVAPRISK